MKISIDNEHTRIYYRYIERLYQLSAFIEYIEPKINESTELSNLFTHSLELSKNDYNINQILKMYDFRRVFNFKPFFLNLLYVFIVMTMENYFNDILREIYTFKIECIKNNQIKYSREEILNFNDLDSLKKKMIEDEIYRFDMKYGYKKKIDYFSNKFNFDLWRINDMENDLVTICEIRNIIIHNDCKVNSEFLNNVNSNKYISDQKIEINKQIISNAINSIIFVLTILDDKIMEKFFKES